MEKLYLQPNNIRARILEHFTVDDVLSRNEDRKIFGIPRGGVHIAYLMAEMRLGTVVHELKNADVIVDDIVDSGKTKSQFVLKSINEAGRELPFYAPYDKTKDDKNAGWIVFPWECDEAGSIEHNVTRILQFLGEDVNREGLLDTPKRVVKSWGKLFEGYSIDPKEMITAFKDGRCDEMVLLKDIEFYSTCEHHMQPFIGKAHIAYLPGEKVLGVSKLARLLDVFARRLQIQERIGQQVTDFLMAECGAKGASCIIEAKHLCMCARGVEKQHSVMSTSSMRGIFREDPAARAELMSMIR